jgi:hypothetical protein
MLTSRFGAHHPLKACPACVEEDEARHHEALWRRAHQWPGVWVCARHRRWLAAAKTKVRGIERFQWVLPDATDFHDHPRQPPGQMFYSLAAVVSGWCSLPPFFSFDPARLAVTYRHAVADRAGLRGGSLDFKALAADYGRWSRELGQVEELAPLMLDATTNASQLGRLLRRPHGRVHPLRHVAVIAWLFDDWEGFCKAYCSAEVEHVAAPAPPATPPRVSPSKRVEAMRTLRDGATTTAAAKQVGVAVATVQRWAAEEGFAIRRRPKLLHADLWRRIAQRLRHGVAQHVVANECGVSRAAVRSVLRCEPGLRAEWLEQVRAAKRRSYRTRWTALRRRRPQASRKALRLAMPAVYAWLYRNDRAWLTANIPPRLARKHAPRQLTLQWNTRDRALCDAVVKAGRALRAAGRPRPVALWRVCREVPALRPKLRALKQLPQTRRALEHLTARCYVISRVRVSV